MSLLAEALRDFDHVAERNPDSASAHTNRSMALRRLGRLDEALLALDRALEIDAEHLRARFGRGVVLKR